MGPVDVEAIGRVERALAPVMRTARDVPAASLTTWRVGGPIALVAYASSVADVEAIARAVDPAIPVLTIGRGSNMLLADAGFPGVGVVLEGELDTLQMPEPGGPNEALAGGALALPVLARQLCGAGWAGLEFYVGIPGSVGGAVRMNAGGHGRETAEVLRRARVVTIDGAGGGEAAWRDVAELDFSYRHSALGDRDVVVGAAFAVTPDEPAECAARLDEIVRWRRANQPGGANAGSVFSNPPGDSAGRLIDAAGLKGTRVGGASVSEKHANFIQADAGATAADVRELIGVVQRRVAEISGARLVPEVRIVGFDHPPGRPEGTRP